jgi:hypothetical protein
VDKLELKNWNWTKLELDKLDKLKLDKLELDKLDKLELKNWNWTLCWTHSYDRELQRQRCENLHGCK